MRRDAVGETALARSATLTARRAASPYPTLRHQPYKHACTGSAHAERSKAVGESTFPFGGSAAAALARSATPTARRAASSYSISQVSPSIQAIQACIYSFCSRHRACGGTVGDSTWPSDGVSGAPAALARSATPTARRFSLSYPPSRASTIQACMHCFCTRSACSKPVGDSTWPFGGGAAAALARSATLTARRFALSYPTSQASPHKHSSMHVSFHADFAKPSQTAPGPLTGCLARRQPWRGVRR